MATLLNTTDAHIWAEEFCRIFQGRTITINEDTLSVDQGTMLSWFANAIMAGWQEGAQAHCPHTDTYPLADDLICCRGCGKLNPGG